MCGSYAVIMNLNERRSMSVVNLKNQPDNNKQPALQPASEDIWDKKYRLKTMNGDAVDANIHETFNRVARALADVEVDDAKREKYYERFLWALENGAIPAGRIISNAGAQAHKPATSTINCTVAGVVPDSMDGILTSVHKAGLTLKAGCGIGYEFHRFFCRRASWCTDGDLRYFTS